MIIDLPPGTGDAQLTLIQAVDLSGAVIVTTPQTVALADAVRGISMFNKLEVPLLGVVENMAWYELPTGERDYVFGQNGGKDVAARYGTDLLAQIPLQSMLRESGDVGVPAALGEGPVADAFASLAAAVASKVRVGEGARA
ncbi:MAG: Mrp/NBP35 family ATP-binding protein [Myxococcales bacterium]|nr:Mrp/NBP35 family ATP-binding protein [Myxococcales bacterium]